MRWKAWLWGVWTLVATTAGIEAALRVVRDGPPGYYHVPTAPGDHTLPYGTYHLDPLGFADTPPAGDRPVVAWIGDSVLFGVGCPQDQRVTEVVERLRPHEAHLNLGTPGFSPDAPARWRAALALAERFHATRAIWLFNLNDVPAPRGRGGWWRLPWGGLGRYSHVYSALDDALVGLQAGGDASPELWPARHRAAFDRAAEAARAVASAFTARQIPLKIVLLPYEMQVSRAAAAGYAAMGATWEDGFVEGSAQRALLDRLGGLDVVDARPAFEDAPRGSWFVSTAGGRADWNHLNAAGHARLGAWLAQQDAGGVATR